MEGQGHIFTFDLIYSTYPSATLRIPAFSEQYLRTLILAPGQTTLSVQ